MPIESRNWSAAPPDVIEANTIKLRRQCRELHGHGQGAGGDGPIIWITCPCSRRIALVYAYKCFYCGIWWCKKCAEDHFEDHHASSGTGVSPVR